MEKNNFFRLLSWSNKLEKNNKELREEDPESYKILLKFLVNIEENFNVFERDHYIKLLKDFLSNKISADNFSYSFIGIYEGIGRKVREMELEESLELANFLNKCEINHLINNLLMETYNACDSFSLDPEISMCDENTLRSHAEILLFKLQEL